MVDEIKLKLMRRKPTLDDLVQPKLSEDARTVFRVAMKRADREQKQLLKKASKL